MRISAVIPTYNEEDIIYWVIKYLLDNDIKVHILDNESTDSTLDIVREFPRYKVSVSSFSTNNKFNEKIQGENIKECLHKLQEDCDWLMKVDADEFLEAPFQEMSLRKGIELANNHGANSIGSANFLFHPMSDEIPHVSGEDIRKFYKHFYIWDKATYFGPGSHPQHNKIYKISAFKSNSDVFYENAHQTSPISKTKIFPHLFILRHYPYRHPERTRKRLITERKKRLSQWNIQNKVSYKYIEFADDEPFLFDHMKHELLKWPEFKKPTFNELF